jgi:hypothetical protein
MRKHPLVDFITIRSITIQQLQKVMVTRAIVM